MYWRVLRHVVRRPAFSNLSSWCQSRGYSTASPTKASKPLRILFCGSDDFSSASLRGLYEEQRRNPELIASIDVLCRPGKPSGRDLKKIREGTLYVFSDIVIILTTISTYQSCCARIGPPHSRKGHVYRVERKEHIIFKLNERLTASSYQTHMMNL
jgi:hypothetical protein